MYLFWSGGVPYQEFPCTSMAVLSPAATARRTQTASKTTWLGLGCGLVHRRFAWAAEILWMHEGVIWTKCHILTNGYAKYSVEVIHRSGDYSIVAKCPVFGGTSRIQATCHVYRMYFS